MAQRNERGACESGRQSSDYDSLSDTAVTISDRLAICRAAFQISPRGAGPASHGAAWQTASMLFPSGSKTKAP
jgi:hypothetical protein